MKFVEACAGIGGLGLGLVTAGWIPVSSTDLDLEAARIHSRSVGPCDHVGVSELTLDRTDFDVLVAGFPCQPFSSSGHRNGFDHSSGNVFEHLLEVIDQSSPSLLVFENVRGLLGTQGGYAFAVILDSLVSRGYTVSWVTVDAMTLGVPQSRPRLFIVGVLSEGTAPSRRGWSEELDALQDLANPAGGVGERVDLGRPSAMRAALRPRIGARSRAVRFGPMGVANRLTVTTYRHAMPRRPIGSVSLDRLGEVCAPLARRRDEIRSVRYWGHSGTTRAYVKADPVAHCMGTSIGAAPLFGVPKRAAIGDLDALHQYSTWSRFEDELFIFRLAPGRSCLLFGSEAARIGEAIDETPISMTSKYRYVGNMVSPRVAAAVSERLGRLWD